MSTFGGGLKYENKRIIYNYGGGDSVPLSVPNGSNYFIFLNKTDSLGVTTRIDRRNYNNTFTASVGSFTNARYMSFFNSEGGSVGYALSYGDRILTPDTKLILSGVAGQNILIEYTEVYFGGLNAY